jgi:hypothetical protein
MAVKLGSPMIPGRVREQAQAQPRQAKKPPCVRNGGFFGSSPPAGERLRND